MTQDTQQPKGGKTARTDDIDWGLTLEDFIVLVNRRRARRGFTRELTEEEYIELYERYRRLPPEKQRVTRLECVEIAEASIAAGRKRMTPEEREATHAKLRSLPPERQRAILDTVRIIVERHKLNQQIADGKAKPN